MSARSISALLFRGGPRDLRACSLVAAGWCLPPLAPLATTLNPSSEEEGSK